MSEIQVVAKVRLNEKADTLWSGSTKQTRVRFAAVSGNSEENKTWAKYTPSGSIELQIDNPSAVDAFELGAEYLVTFTKYVAPQPKVEAPVAATA